MVTARRRAQSFSHVPRPRLSREEFIRYLGDRVAAEHARCSDPTDSSAVDSGAILEEDVDGAKKNDMVGKDGDPQASEANLVEGGAAVSEGGVVVGSDDRSNEVMPRKHLLRRWPSGADIGMLTDGR